MFRLFGLFFGTLVRLFRSHHRLLLENLALRQQLVALKRRHTRPELDLFDKLFWVLVRRCWSGWKQALLVVKPETVVPIWFNRITQQAIRRGTFSSVKELVAKIDHYVQNSNPYGQKH
jgi:hypothetical protein